MLGRRSESDSGMDVTILFEDNLMSEIGRACLIEMQIKMVGKMQAYMYYY